MIYGLYAWKSQHGQSLGQTIYWYPGALQPGFTEHRLQLAQEGVSIQSFPLILSSRNILRFTLSILVNKATLSKASEWLKDISSPDFSTPSFNPGPFNSRLFNHEIFYSRLFNHEFLKHGVENFMVEKSGVEKFMVEKFMVEKSGVERSRVEAWG